jgi:hypothetical protein
MTTIPTDLILDILSQLHGFGKKGVWYLALRGDVDTRTREGHDTPENAKRPYMAQMALSDERWHSLSQVSTLEQEEMEEIRI